MPKAPTFENALSFAQDLIRIPSPPGGEAEVAERVRREMEELGLDDVRIDSAGNVVGAVAGIAAGPTVMLSSHLDVVAEGDPEEWEHPPFSGAVDRGFLHGRGAMDIKGPLAIQTYGAAAVRGRSPGDVVVAHTVFEERGGLGMKLLLESGEVVPQAVVIGEATHGDICTGHRGRGEVEIRIRGAAGHASAPERAHNALDLVPAVLSAVRDLASRQPSDPTLGPATVVATSVDVAPVSRNVIPDRATVAVDWRLLPGQVAEALLSDVRQAIDARVGDPPEGLSFTVGLAEEEQATFTGRVQTQALFTPGFLMDAEDSIVRAAAGAVGRRGGAGHAMIRPWTFATDGGWTSGVFGIPTLGFAPGEERFAHTNRERLDLDEARWALGRHPSLILAIQKALAATFLRD